MSITKFLAQKRREQPKKGFTLTEIAIVLGIMGLVLGAIWVAASGVYNNQRVNNANTAVMQMAQGIRALFATSSTTGLVAVGNMTTGLITARAVPNNLVVTAGGNTFLEGPLPGGFTTIEGNGDGSGFVIVMTGATQSTCINLLMAVGGTSRDPGLYEAIAAGYANSAAAPFTTGAASLAHTAYAVAVTPSAMTVVPTPTLASAAVANAFGGCNNTLHAMQFGFSLK